MNMESFKNFIQRIRGRLLILYRALYRNVLRKGYLLAAVLWFAVCEMISKVKTEGRKQIPAALEKLKVLLSKENLLNYWKKTEAWLKEVRSMPRHEFVKKYSLLLSSALLVLWCLMGTTTTLAWFSDTTPAVRNSFEVGKLELKVEYRNQRMTEYETVDEKTVIFDDEALYEPGYTQVVYLKIHNTGNMPFQYKIAVDQVGYTDSINVYGGNLHLPNFLRFGVLIDAEEQTLTRRTSQAVADKELGGLRLNQYALNGEQELAAGDTCYAALIVYMPEETGNAANYRRGEQEPSVALGITVYAQQTGTPME